MRNPLKEKLSAGRPVYGVFVTTASAPLVRVLAGCGIDWVMIDLEHGAIGPESAQAMIVATAGTACSPLVRVPHHRPDLAEVALDAGAYGLIAPMVNSRAEAEAAEAILRYPPKGVRGSGPFHAAVHWGLSLPEYYRTADAELLNVVLVEHVDAIRNLDAILSTPGVDVASIAPMDLSTSLGRPGQRDHPDVLAAIAEIESKVLASPVALGGVALSPEEARRKVDRGYRFVFLGNDVMLLQRAVAGALEDLPR